MIIENIDSDNKTLKVNKDPKNWESVGTQCCRRIIGFYYDGGDVNEKLYADAYVTYPVDTDWRKNDAELGAYCHIDHNEKVIKLSQELDQGIRNRITLNKTVIRNHYGNSTYVYPFDFSMDNIQKDNNWHSMSHTINGVSADFGVSDNTKFRKGTKYIKLGIYCDKGQDIWFNNLKFERCD